MRLKRFMFCIDPYPPPFLAKYGAACSPDCPCRLTDSERDLLQKALAEREAMRQEQLLGSER